MSNLNTINMNNVIDMCVNITSMYYDYKDKKHTYIFELSTLCNRLGIPMETLKRVLSEKYEMSEDDLNVMVDGAYYPDEHGRAKFLADALLTGDIPDIGTSPFFPKEIYDSLPGLLKIASQILPDGRQKDMFLVSAITVISGCLNNYEGLYDGKSVHPNLFNFITAPAASGKGVCEYAKRLGETYHNSLVEKGKLDSLEYKEVLQDYKLSKEDSDDSEFERPKEPKKKVLFIPANSSSAAFFEKMMNSDGRVILFETEADTLSSTFKQDWGGYSEIMRSAFHQETVSVNRKGDCGIMEIKRPRLSVSLTGTPAQVVSLIKSQENGLFSRFMFYTFSDIAEWRDVSPSQNISDKGAFFDELSIKVHDMVKFFDEHETKFSFTNKQWEEFNSHYKFLVDYYGLSGGNSDISSVITRNGLIRFRIAMVLSALSRYENQDKSDELECTDDNFDLAEKIANVLLVHSFIVMKQLPRQAEVSINTTELKFLQSLPNEFDRNSAIDKGAELNIKARSSDGYLKRLIDKGKLERVGNGQYQKK